MILTDGDVLLLQFLLVSLTENRHDILINARDEMGDTPFFKAVTNGHCEIVKQYLRLRDPSQIGLNLRNNVGHGVFHLASSVEMLKLMIDIFNEDEPVETPPSPYAERSPMRFFISFPDFVSGAPEHELAVSPMHHVRNNILISLKCQRLLNEGDRNGQTPLHIAVKQNYPEIVKYLLTLISKHDPSRLDLQAGNNNSFLKKSRLIYPCMNVNAVDNKGNTPFHLAVARRSTEMIKIFSENSECRTDIKNSRGETVRHLLKKVVN
jgi:ankyrin repeat protein